jgi:hypothetical protein
MVKRITKKRGGASFNGKNTKDVYSLKNDKFFTLDKPAKFNYCCVLGPFGIVYITGKYIEKEIDEFKVSRFPLYKIQQNSSLNADVILHRDENTRQISLQYKFIFSNTSMYDVIVSGKFLILKNDGKYLKKETKLELGLKQIGTSLNGPTQNEGLALNDPAPKIEGLSLNDPEPNERLELNDHPSLNYLPEQDRKYFSSSIENSNSTENSNSPSYYIMINGKPFFIIGKLNEGITLFKTTRTKPGVIVSLKDIFLEKKDGQIIINFMKGFKGFERFTVSQSKPSRSKPSQRTPNV